jgi:hypothetical protein
MSAAQDDIDAAAIDTMRKKFPTIDGDVAFMNKLGDEYLANLDKATDPGAPRRRTSRRAREEKQGQWKRREGAQVRIQAAMQLMYDMGASNEAVEDYFNVITITRPLSPADRFMNDWLRKNPKAWEGNSEVDYQALEDLIRSDVPLDRATRQGIADTLHDLRFPNPARDRQYRQWKRQRENRFLEMEMQAARDSGMTVNEAKAAIVNDGLGKHYGIKTVAALERRLRPSRK